MDRSLNDDNSGFSKVEKRELDNNEEIDFTDENTSTKIVPEVLENSS